MPTLSMLVAVASEHYLTPQRAWLDRLALIVRGADTSDKDLTPESRGLDAIAGGFQQMELSDHEKLDREFPVYDALYVYCGGALPIPTPSGKV